MPRVRPFEALVYDRDVAGPLEAVTSRPYDVISDDHRLRYLDASPHNIVRIDLGDGGAGPERDARAAATLAAWVDEGALRRVPPTYVAYEMAYRMPRDDTGDPPRILRGVIAAMELEPWGGSVVPHEDVMDAPLRDRLGLLRATRTHLSPIYGTVGGPIAPLDGFLATIATTPPDAEVVDEEEVRHRAWLVGPDVPVDRWVADRELLVADGHHRYTTALAYRDERRASDGPGPWDAVLTFVVDRGAQPVPVLPFHRVQRRGVALDGGEPTDLDGAVASLADVPPTIASVRPGAGGPAFAVHRLAAPPPAVMALHATATLPVDDDLAYTPDAEEAIDAVASGEAIAAYLLPATDPERILSVVRSGARLPPKSTFFWPKPRTGFVLMPLDDPAGDP